MSWHMAFSASFISLCTMSLVNNVSRHHESNAIVWFVVIQFSCISIYATTHHTILFPWCCVLQHAEHYIYVCFKWPLEALVNHTRRWTRCCIIHDLTGSQELTCHAFRVDISAISMNNVVLYVVWWNATFLNAYTYLQSQLYLQHLQ